MDSLKAIGKALGLTFAVWIATLVIITMLSNWFVGLLLATLFTGVGFICWSLFAHPEFGEFLVSVIFGADVDRLKQDAAEQQDAENAERYLRRYRRGDPRDST